MPIGKTPSPYGIQQPYVQSPLESVTKIPQTAINPTPPGGGTVTAVTGTPPIVSSGGATPAISLADTAVTPGSYTYTALTVDSKGRITAASSGSAPTGTVTSVDIASAAGTITPTGGPITTSGTIDVDITGLAPNDNSTTLGSFSRRWSNLYLGAAGGVFWDTGAGAHNIASWADGTGPTWQDRANANEKLLFNIQSINSPRTATWQNSSGTVAWLTDIPVATTYTADGSTLQLVGTTFSEKDGGTTDAKLANMGALTVKGRSANSSGVPADISASAASGAVLRESGSTIGFGTIATSGIANNAVTLPKLATQADSTVLSNISGGAAIPAANTITATLDYLLGSTQGMVAYRGSSAWTAISPGTTGYVLTTNGAAANPSWTAGGAIPSTWATALDLDFSAQGSQTLNADTTYSIGGFTWTKANSANDNVSMAVTNGTGLVIQPKASTNYAGTTRTGPYISVPLTSLAGMSGFDVTWWLRVYVYISADTMAANDSVFVAMDNGQATNAANIQFFAARISTATIRAQAAFGVAASTLDATHTHGTDDRVLMFQFPAGVFSFLYNIYYGPIGGGNAWPAISTMTPILKSSGANFSADGLVTGSNLKLVIGAFRNSVGTPPSFTVRQVRVDFRQ